MEKYINTGLLGVIVILLAATAYSTGLGKIIPQQEPIHLSCDSLLTQQLFYSELIDKNNSDDKGLESTAKNVLHAGSVEEITKIVTSNTNIDASKTVFYSSLSNSGDCQAHISLEQAKQDGNNAMYVPYSITGYVPTNALQRTEGGMVEEIHINFLNIDNEKE